MADEEKKGRNTGKVIGAAAGVALTAAAAAAAGAILTNKDLRQNLGKRALTALETVSKLAQRAEQETQKGIKYLESKTKQMSEEEKGAKSSKKTKAK